MQYHASLITADGAYHCPVGSIMAIFLVEGLMDMSCVRMKIFYQVKITGAKKGLVHVSQNIPTKSALSVSLTRPEDVIIQVHGQHTIVI